MSYLGILCFREIRNYLFSKSQETYRKNEFYQKKTAIGESMAVSRSQTQHGMDRYDCAGIRMFEMGCPKQGVLYSVIRQKFDGL
tara:strand:+ start:9462 stop:9713 length:252 start_codon:yes stop_codon:yes gene_type:complete